MYLTDDLDEPTKWQIPAGVIIPARSTLLFWADNDPEQGDQHTNFKINRAGESIGLFDTDAHNNGLIDQVTFGKLSPDVSYGRWPDGEDTWVILNAPTPGTLNKE